MRYAARSQHGCRQRPVGSRPTPCTATVGGLEDCMALVFIVLFFGFLLLGNAGLLK